MIVKHFLLLLIINCIISCSKIEQSNKLNSFKISKNAKRQINRLYFEDKINNRQIVSCWNKKQLTWSLVNHPLSLSWNETLNAFQKGKLKLTISQKF